MTQKDYIRLARVLKDSKQTLTGINPLINQAFESQWKFTINRIAYELQADNPRFNRDRFLNACGYNN